MCPWLADPPPPRPNTASAPPLTDCFRSVTTVVIFARSQPHVMLVSLHPPHVVIVCLHRCSLICALLLASLHFDSAYSARTHQSYHNLLPHLNDHLLPFLPTPPSPALNYPTKLVSSFHPLPSLHHAPASLMPFPHTHALDYTTTHFVSLYHYVHLCKQLTQNQKQCLSHC